MRHFLYLSIALAGAWFGNSSAVIAQQPKVAEFLPSSTAFYATVDQPGKLLDSILQHPTVQVLEDNPEIKKLLASPEFAMAMVGKAYIEKAIDDTLINSFKTNTDGGICLAFDPSTEGVALVFKSGDETKLKRLAGSVLKMISADATQKGKDVPFKKRTYRDAAVAEFDGFLIARYQSWFLACSKPQLARQIVDAMHDGNPESLNRVDWFKKCREQVSSADAWAAIDLEVLRKSGKAKELFSGRTDNPGAELIFGGMLDALQHAPVATASLNLDRDIELDVALPFQKEWASEPREYFFGPDLQGTAPPRLLPEKLIASITSYRDISGWWLSKEDLFEENVIAGLAQADSQLSTIFSGMDFGEDVLGALQPGIQIVVSENHFDDAYVPDVKLPAFAVIGKLKDVPNIQRRFKIAYQSVIGFANINLGMEGQPQLDLETETIDGSKVSSATYAFDEETEEGLLLFNFAPTLAFHEQHFILSSNKELAVELARLAAQSGRETDANTLMEVDGKMLARILRDNRESLITNNMLEEGNDRAAAEKQIDLVLSIVDLVRSSKLDFAVDEKQMTMKLNLSFDE